MKKEIESAAKKVGITALITNSERKIETQLNKLTGVEDLPIMLVSWDYETTLSFDENGFLNNPVTNIVCLLMTKADSKVKSDMEEAAEKMGFLFTGFIRELNNILKLTTRDGSNGLEDISYINSPFYGLGKHSGILGRFTMKTQIIDNCIDPHECGFVQQVVEIEENVTFQIQFVEQGFGQIDEEQDSSDNTEGGNFGVTQIILQPAPQFVLDSAIFTDTEGVNIEFQQIDNNTAEIQFPLSETNGINVSFNDNSIFILNGGLGSGSGTYTSNNLVNEVIQIPVAYNS